MSAGRGSEWTELKMRWRESGWVRRGRVPGASGHSYAKWAAIERALAGAVDHAYGHDDAGLDERVVEYPWALHRIAARRSSGERILDAGSVLNHPRILAHCRRAGLTPLSIVTLHYEGRAEVSDDVRYEFGDLRELPYRDGWFSSVVCLSTLEHVGMDNAGYGDTAGMSSDPAREVTRAMVELRRVTRTGGSLLLSVPFGERASRGWLRIFDDADVRSLVESPGWGVDRSSVFRATRDGWRECSMEEAGTAGYNEPLSRRRPSVRTAPDWVAAAEAVALIELTAV